MRRSSRSDSRAHCSDETREKGATPRARARRADGFFLQNAFFLAGCRDEKCDRDVLSHQFLLSQKSHDDLANKGLDDHARLSARGTGIPGRTRPNRPHQVSRVSADRSRGVADDDVAAGGRRVRSMARPVPALDTSRSSHRAARLERDRRSDDDRGGNARAPPRRPAEGHARG
jgi:hypothetical protein